MIDDQAEQGSGDRLGDRERRKESGQPGQIVLELAACAAAVWGIARLAASEMVTGAQPAAEPEFGG